MNRCRHFYALVIVAVLHWNLLPPLASSAELVPQFGEVSRFFPNARPGITPDLLSNAWPSGTLRVAMAEELSLEDLGLESEQDAEGADGAPVGTASELRLDELTGDTPADSVSDSADDDSGGLVTNATDLPSMQRWEDNLRQTLDLAVRPVFVGGDIATASFLGIDLHKVFTNATGDWGTLTLQPYITRLDNFGRFPGFFEDGHDFELVYRICNFNYTGWGRGKPYVRIGHMEIPYGLEQIINTNGTLRDYTHVRNIGVKADWGISLNGETEELEYEVALMRGSGNEYRRRGSPFLLAGRIGTPRGEPFVFGASLLHGNIFRYGGLPPVRRTRAGLDVTWAGESLVWLAEASAGFEQDTPVFNSVFECDWYSKLETVLLYNQVFVFAQDVDAHWLAEVSNFLGIRYQPDRHWALSAQWMQLLQSVSTTPTNGFLQVQLRYRF